MLKNAPSLMRCNSLKRSEAKMAETLATNAAKDLPLDHAAHLLVVDDDRRIRELLKRFLGENGFRVSVASHAAEARRLLDGMNFDLLVVDVMMPGESGVSFTKWLRETRDLPVLMLTALSETDHRIDGLSAGADDYLAKPFDPRELNLRIHNILKRSKDLTPQTLETLSFGGFCFNLLRRELKFEQKLVRLTERELDMLSAFAAKPRETIARHELAADGSDISERTIDVQINRLRRKIEADPANPVYLQTVRGIGYRLMAD
jgi:two-component system, OmpR family, phosphate regulon response regulator OmpR